MRSLSLSSQVPTIFLLSGQVNKVNHLNQTNQGGSSEQNKVKQVFREAILQKIPEFYEIFSQTGMGSIGFHISYSEIVNTLKSVAKSE